MNYNIIADREELQKFIDWLPETSERHKFYLCLLARNKYSAIPLNSNNTPLSRKVFHKKELMNKIWQMEVPIGAYTQKDGTPISNQSLVLYMTINPRDLWKASIESAKNIVGIVGHGKEEFSQNPYHVVMSAIHKSSSDREFTIFDVDSKVDGDEILNKIFDIVGKQPYIETRGGYHILVRHKEVKSIYKDWYKILTEFADAVGDEMSPIPGTFQGGFCVRFNENK